MRTDSSATRVPSDHLGWRGLPRPAQAYVGIVIVAGAYTAAVLFPRTWQPTMFVALLCCSCLTSAWKVTLPIPLASRATLSVSYAADLMALLLLGPRPAILVAIAGAFTQCIVNARQIEPWYRTVFSMAAEALTMAATGLVYTGLGGRPGALAFETLPRPLVGAIATYFFLNTGLVAGAIAMSLRQSPWVIWRDGFLWSGPSFMVAGTGGAIAALLVEHGGVWIALLMFAPVYLTYRTYDVFLKRLEEQKRHIEETTRLHQEAVDALLQARRAEQALAEEKERLSVTLRSIGDGVMTTDLDGTILMINSVAETLTGWTQQEAVGQPLGLVFRNFEPETREPCDNSVSALTSRAARLGAGRSTILVARDLSERPIEESAAPLGDLQGRTIGMVLAFRDITDSLRIQAERAKAARLESLGLLAGGIAHDFNNILTSILGNVSMARATWPHDGAPINLLSDAEQACVRARQLTWRLLTFSKGGVPAKKTLGIARILRESAVIALRGSAVRCTFDLPPQLWAVEADEVQLVQVFSNVFINAKEAMPQGGVIAVRAENVIEADRRSESALPVVPGNYLRVSIVDEGIGIPREHIGRIFDPYFSTKQRGSGLGLATTYSIVKNHGGFLVIESSLGRGTTVQVSLPASSSHAISHPVERPAVPRAGGRRRVLVMDDEASIRTLTSNMLQFLGYDTEVVDSGSAAIERCARKNFDVVMLDLIVPGKMGGEEAMRRLAGMNPSVKAILVSGHTRDSVLADFRDHGFQAVIAKPFTLQELSATLYSVIGSPGAPSAAAALGTPPGWRVH
jgi:PAS domain S-box-containing protein